MCITWMGTRDCPYYSLFQVPFYFGSHASALRFTLLYVYLFNFFNFLCFFYLRKVDELLFDAE